MTVNIANVDSSTDNFAAWLSKTNQMLEAFRHQVVSVSNSSISYSTGNAAIIGRFTADIMVANSSLRGGNNSSTNTLNITSNVNVTNTISVQGLKIQNSTVNVNITLPTLLQQANDSVFLHANGNFVHIDLVNLTGTANNALHLGGVLAAEYINIDDAFIIDGVHTHNANIVLNEALIANGSAGSAGFVLTSNGTSVYWSEVAAGSSVAGSNTWIQFNDNGVLGAVAGWTFNKVTNTYSIGNSSVNSNANSTALVFGTTSYAKTGANIGIVGINATAITVGANVVVASDSVTVGNSTINSVHTQTLIQLSNSTYIVSMNTSSIGIGNLQTYMFGNSTFLTISNSTSTANLLSNSLKMGTIEVNTTMITLGANVVITPSGASVGNSTANIVISSTNITKNGQTIVPLGQHTIWVPAGAMIPRTSNGATFGTIETTTNKIMLRTLDFSGSTGNNNYGQFQVQMPKSWDEGTIVAQVVWNQSNTTTNYGVVWTLESIAFSDSDPADSAFGTAVTMTDTGGTNNDIYISPESSAMTVGGSPSAEDLVIFQIGRTPSHASDTMTVNARLVGVRLHYTTDAASDT